MSYIQANMRQPATQIRIRSHAITRMPYILTTEHTFVRSFSTWLVRADRTIRATINYMQSRLPSMLLLFLFRLNTIFCLCFFSFSLHNVCTSHSIFLSLRVKCKLSLSLVKTFEVTLKSVVCHLSMNTQHAHLTFIYIHTAYLI